MPTWEERHSYRPFGGEIPEYDSREDARMSGKTLRKAWNAAHHVILGPKKPKVIGQGSDGRYVIEVCDIAGDTWYVSEIDEDELDLP